MIHRVDDRLRREALEFGFVFSCEDCAQYDPERDRCSLEYPHDVHRTRDLEGRQEVVFCKAFELR